MQLRTNQKGLTLVEIMVSTVVALVAGLAIMQTFAVAEGFRRTGTTGGDASFNGAIGAYLISHDLSVAGYGVNTSLYYGCLASGTLVSASTSTPFSFSVIPVQITPGAGTAPDAITVVASNTDMMPGPITTVTNMAANTDNYTVTSAFGVQAGDVLLLAQAGNTTCTVTQATNTPISGASNQSTILHASGSYSSNGTSHKAVYNPAGGIGPTYPAGSVVIDMGPTPLVNSYYIQNNTLMVNQVAAGVTGAAVASNIVQLKAFYGKDTNGDGIVDTWDNVALTGSNWSEVMAMRIAVVARSMNPEKPSNATTGACNTTTASPVVTWEDGTTTTLDVSGSSASWQCYRYKVFHMTTSMRNLIWTPS